MNDMLFQVFFCCFPIRRSKMNTFSATRISFFRDFLWVRAVCWITDVPIVFCCAHYMPFITCDETYGRIFPSPCGFFFILLLLHTIVIPNALILNIKYGAWTDDSIARMWNNQAVGQNFRDQLAAQELQRKKTNKRSETSTCIDMEYRINFSILTHDDTHSVYTYMKKPI